VPHRKKRFTSFPSPAGMSLTKFPLGRNNSVMTSLFPPRESLIVTSRLGTGNSRIFFLRCKGLDLLGLVQQIWPISQIFSEYAVTYRLSIRVLIWKSHIFQRLSGRLYFLTFVMKRLDQGHLHSKLEVP
jgi:hypothetical protein